MRAVTRERYGPPNVLALRDVPKPQPGEGEVLIRMVATTVSRTDCGLLRGRPALFVRPAYGLLRPRHRILGLDFAGVVAQTGTGVKLFSRGDRVFGLSSKTFGAHAEYLCLPESSPMAQIPDGIDFADAVAGEGVWYANTYLDAFGVADGERMLIYGASGAIGTAAVQLAKIRGAEVTAVVSRRHMDLAASLGADRVIDYTAEDFTAIGETFDYVLDAVGKTSWFRCRKLLRRGGVFSATDLGPLWQNIALSAWPRALGGGSMVFPVPSAARQSILKLAQSLAAREFRTVIDCTYSLDEIVEAFRYVETAKKTGVVVIDLRS